MSNGRLRDPIAEARRHWVAHGWEEAAAGMAAVTTITRAQQILAGRVEEVLAPLGLTFARFEILRLLGFSRTGGLPMGKISDRLQVHPASVTSAVKRLERERLIERVVDRTDNRVIHAVLLPKGRDLLDPATTAVNEVFATLGLSDHDLDQLVRLLDPIRHSAGDEVEPSPMTSHMSGR
ncbi:MAG TPA: MarR family transcriptional regulator [Acidimicrobiia bacterium]|nr:MarR family transcriptional regulator [Acidimicrobiia bacterium]